ncbi:hypothetical protein PhCBS80983_g02942 [Powellomyces hirtus]|uniref:Uncharacterized protein n=1 Tax=Powellomyces hirtus TaxID=109895 RepID=A0A507E3P3_9FUNG|nr:hypothetical protein PhCBS80983_g02942 [Powellomyces hirtus]
MPEGLSADGPPPFVEHDATEPLIGQRLPQKSPTWSNHLRAVFDEHTVKASVTYLVAIALSLSQFSDRHFQGSCYLLAMAVLYFHPARTVGAMVEAMICCIVGLGIGFLIAKGCTAMAMYYEDTQRNELEAHAIAVGTLFITTFFVAFIRARWSRENPAIGTACTLTHFLTFVTITQISSKESLAVLPDNIARITLALLAGTVLSFIGCCVIHPQTASSVIRQDIAKGFNTLRSFFDMLARTFSLISESAPPSAPPTFTGNDENDTNAPLLRSESLETLHSAHEALENLLETHQAMLLRLDTSRFATFFEPTTSLHLHRRRYQKIFRSVERLSQHLAGLQSSITEVDKIITEDADNVALVEFITNMGPSLRQLVIICKQSLALLESLFAAPVPNASDAEVLLPALQNLFERLALAHQDFDESQRRVLVEIYHHVHEDVFLVFFFVFELMEFVKELMRLVSAVEALKREVIERREMGRLKWWWTTVWARNDEPRHARSPIQDRRAERTGRSVPDRRRFSKTLTITGMADIMDDIPVSEPWSHRLWSALASLKDFEARFAFKTAITVTLLSLPAFLDVTQNFFQEYRMHWSLSTFIVVMTPSVGGTNAAGVWRLFGTVAGAGMAVLSSVLFPGSPIGLFCMAALVCVPCMHIFLNTEYPMLGQISLITFTIIIFNDFSGALDPTTGEQYSIFEIAFRRGVSVTVGVVMGMFVSWYIWPFTARKALRLGLSGVIFDIGLLYSRLVGLFDSAKEPTRQDMHEFLEDELELRLSLARLRILLEDTAHEPRLRGPFPTDSYARLIDGCSHILNKLISMRSGMTVNGFARIRADFVTPVQPQRQKMIGTMLLYFYLISGALILRYPLPPQLPDAREARLNLIEAIRSLPVIQPREVGSQKDPAYIYYYAYVMGMDDIVRELEGLGSICIDLFGVMALGGIDDGWRDRWGDGD